MQNQPLETDPVRRKARRMALDSAQSKARKKHPEIGSCEQCGAPGVDRHHDDYEKPELIRVFCRKCHAAWHREHGHSPTPATFMEALLNGLPQYSPIIFKGSNPTGKPLPQCMKYRERTGESCLLPRGHAGLCGWHDSLSPTATDAANPSTDATP